MDFIALDVETANASLASICQVGIVTFRGGQVVDQWQTLVNPEDYFDGLNVAIHGITPEMVEDAPTFPRVARVLQSTLKDRIVVSHMPFDQVAISRAAERYRLPNLECTWLDSARVARRAWEQYRQRGYGLASLANDFGISFQHHNAQEDARAAGEVLLKAIADTGVSLQEWLVRAYRPISSTSSTVTRAGNPDGPLAGEVIVFTGALAMPRRQRWAVM